MQREVIEVPVISQALRDLGAPVSALVRAGDMLYTCGMPPIDPQTGAIVRGDATTQARVVMAALAHTLAAGGASLDQVVKALVFVGDNAMAAPVNAVYREHFPNGFPARTCVAIQTWSQFDLEIECIALRS